LHPFANYQPLAFSGQLLVLDEGAAHHRHDNALVFQTPIVDGQLVNSANFACIGFLGWWREPTQPSKKAGATIYPGPYEPLLMAMRYPEPIVVLWFFLRLLL
jgi:hypothetical protein